MQIDLLTQARTINRSSIPGFPLHIRKTSRFNNRINDNASPIIVMTRKSFPGPPNPQSRSDALATCRWCSLSNSINDILVDQTRGISKQSSGLQWDTGDYSKVWKEHVEFEQSAILVNR